MVEAVIVQEADGNIVSTRVSKGIFEFVDFADVSI
jgi:hypothetical protein